MSPYYALLDSGADRIIFPSDLALEIGINNIKTGRSEPTLGIAGQAADVYYHQASLQVVGDARKFSVEVGFSEKITLPILGRTFFAHYKAVIFYEPKGTIEFKQ